tara:strand:+ start:736 stop:930 length:195 start_codon:yes stop_codon:yes gene_type:complete
MKLKLNQDLNTPKGKELKGAIINLECDANKIPLNIFWRKRLKDSAIDNCVEVVLEKISQSKSKK